MKQDGRAALYENWEDYIMQDHSLKGFDKIEKIAEMTAEVDFEELISAASDLQREAWLHGFNYAVKFLMNQ